MIAVFNANGSFRVYVPMWDVVSFKEKWPCSGLPDRVLWFDFAANGDLVDLAEIGESVDGGAISALTDDAKTFGLQQKKGKSNG